MRIWSHLLKKSLMENFIFVQCPEYMSKGCEFRCIFLGFTVTPLTYELKRTHHSRKKALFNDTTSNEVK